jgi:hypothetical protein
MYRGKTSYSGGHINICSDEDLGRLFSTTGIYLVGLELSFIQSGVILRPYVIRCMSILSFTVVNRNLTNPANITRTERGLNSFSVGVYIAANIDAGYLLA